MNARPTSWLDSTAHASARRSAHRKRRGRDALVGRLARPGQGRGGSLAGPRQVQVPRDRGLLGQPGKGAELNGEAMGRRARAARRRARRASTGRPGALHRGTSEPDGPGKITIGTVGEPRASDADSSHRAGLPSAVPSASSASSASVSAARRSPRAVRRSPGPDRGARLARRAAVRSAGRRTGCPRCGRARPGPEVPGGAHHTPSRSAGQTSLAVSPVSPYQLGLPGQQRTGWRRSAHAAAQRVRRISLRRRRRSRRRGLRPHHRHRPAEAHTTVRSEIMPNGRGTHSPTCRVAAPPVPHQVCFGMPCSNRPGTLL